MSGQDDLSPLEASTGEEQPLPHDPPPPPGWEDPIESAEILEDPSTAFGGDTDQP